MKLGKKKKAEQQDDFLAQEAVQEQQTAPEYTLDIPEDEIWTYQIDGLQAPHIGQRSDQTRMKKAIVVIVLIIAIGLSIFMSVRAVHNDEYKFKQLDSGYQLVKYSNPGDETEVTIDFVGADSTKPVTQLKEYAFNCDEKIVNVNLGKDIEKIDGKSFYSCWALENVFIDDDNPYYCDLDGVIYTKDMTQIIYYPSNHDKYLRQKTGYDNLVDDKGEPMEELWGTTDLYDEEFFNEYNKQVRTYVVPSTVTKIGELAFAYSNITDLYFPEGLKTIETMGVFKNTQLLNIYTYTTDSEITDTTFNAIQTFNSQYNSLPEGLEFIGSDAFTYDSGLKYMYIPSSVKQIDHHAFWDTVFKKDGNLDGITEIDTGYDEQSFKNVTLGGDWRPKYDYMLFKKSVDVNYSAQRK